ncbi:MAG: hypothetical protein NZ770_04675, partial [Candidatus Poseidoniaceae archaeon]|nr:hypothetical protein [Candidatus Poseidoniaceae archaeon]
MLSPVAVRNTNGRGMVSALVLLFILGYFTPMVPVSFAELDEAELDSVSRFEASARSGTGWAKMSGGSANGNARYIDVVPSSGDIAIGGLMDGGAATLSWGGVSVTSGDTVTPWYAKTDSGGNVSWVQVATASGSNSPEINAGGLAISNTGDVYVTGSFRDTASFGSHTLVSQGLYDCFIAKISSSGQWQWAKSLKGAADARTGATTSLDVVWGTSITVDAAGSAIIGGFYLGSTEVGNNAGTGINDADVFVAKYSSSGNNNWLADATGPDVNEVFSMTSDMGGDVWLVTSFDTSMSFGTYSVSASGGGHPVIAKISAQGGWMDAQHGTSTSDTYTGGIDVDMSGDPVIAGIFSGSLTFGSTTINSMGEDDGYIAKYSAGSWIWATHVGTSTYDFVSDVATDPSSGNAIVAMSSAGSLSIAGSSFSSQGENDTIIASIDTNGAWERMVSAHGSQDNWAGGVAVDDHGNVAVAGTASGTIDFTSTNAGTASPSGQFGPYLWSISGFGSSDSDGDGIFDEDDNCPDDHNSGQEDHDSDTQGDECDIDDDNDGVLDNNGNRSDDCPLGELNWTSTSIQSDPASSSDWDIDGCKDDVEDPDMDNDQKENSNDTCLRTDWNRGQSPIPTWVSDPDTDQDMDGCRDADEDLDDDNDGVEDSNDNCPDDTGTSNKGSLIGCPDGDGDGWADTLDDCPDTYGTSENGTMVGCEDTDGDGWADSIDALPLEPTQWLDSDGDGYGDNINGYKADDCPQVAGGSMEDRQGCKDSDSDGWSDADHMWSIDDGADALPNDPTQWTDFDGDGYGDNYGNHSWSSTRPEGWPGQYELLALNQDACPIQFGDSTQGEVLGCSDRDGDGWADFIDAFPDDSLEHQDSDKDGVADGSDDCPSTNGGSEHDRKGCVDLDGDGWSDPDALWTVGNGADAFREEPTQWSDSDGDGYGDSSVGIQPDACPNTFGTSSKEGNLGCPPATDDGGGD